MTGNCAEARFRGGTRQSCRFLRDLKRPEDALASYDRAVALNPDHPEGYSNRGWCYRIYGVPRTPFGIQ